MQRGSKRVSHIKIGAVFYLIVVFLALFALSSCENKVEEKNLSQIREETAKFLEETNPQPQSSSIGGEWQVLGIKLSGFVPSDEMYNDYYQNSLALLRQTKGKLSEDKPTDFARMIIGLKAAGKNPVEQEGYNLIEPLDNYRAVKEQGINAESFALIASKVAGKSLSNEGKYLEDIVSEINKGSYDKKDQGDYISIMLEALAFYKDDPKVKDAIDKGLTVLSKHQEKDGSYGNCESTAEAIIALGQLGINPLEDERFIKDNKNLFDGLLVYYKGKGGFCHIAGKKSDVDMMATEKALLALDSLEDNKPKGIYQEVAK